MKTPFKSGYFPVLFLWPFEKNQISRLQIGGGDYIRDLQPHECFPNKSYLAGPFPFQNQYGDVEDYEVYECQVCGDIFEY